MEVIREQWDKVVVFYKDHKLIVIISAIFAVVVILLAVILISSASNTAPTPTASVPPVNTTGTTTNTGNLGGDVGDDLGGEVNDDDITDGGGSSDDAGDKVQLEVWGGFLGESSFETVIAGFEDENPDVEIVYTAEISKSADINSYKSRLEDNVGGSGGPDIFFVDSGWARNFFADSQAAPNGVFSPTSVAADFGSYVATDFSDGEFVYGVPYAADNLAIIYNKEMWSAAGLTTPDSDWNNFVDNQLTELESYFQENSIEAASISVGGENTEFTYELLVTLFLQSQITLIEDGEVTLSNGSLDQGVVDFYNELKDASSWDSTYNIDIAAFLEGKLATYIAPSWRLNDVLRYDELGSLGLDVGVSELPQIATSQTDFSNFANYYGFMVDANSEHVDIAWEFLAYLVNEGNLELLNEDIKSNPNTELGIVYPLISMSSEQSSDEYMGPYAAALEYTKSYPVKDEQLVKDTFLELAEGTSTLDDLISELEGAL